MKSILTIASVIFGGLFVYLCFHIGVIQSPSDYRVVEHAPNFSLPTYLSFVGVMLTSVTVMLAAVTIGIGLVAAVTFSKLEKMAMKTLEEAK